MLVINCRQLDTLKFKRSLHIYFQDILYEKFSPFGLLYEVFIVDSRLSTTVDPNQLDSVTKKSHSCPGSLYAFVKFYSQRAAARAKRELTGQLCIAGNCIKVNMRRMMHYQYRELYYYINMDYY